MRLKNLDLIKWVALITMLIDHLRFLNPASSQFDLWCYSIGRLAYPLFLFLMAHYFYRSKDKHNILASDQRYFKNLIVYAFLSEIPYQLYFTNTQSLNIFPTLILCFILLYAYVRKPVYAPVYFFIPLVLTLILNQTKFSIQYDVLGVYAILCFYLAFLNKNLIFLPILISIMFNLYLVFNLSHNFSLLLNTQLWKMSLAFIVIIILGIWFSYQYLNREIKFNIAPVNKWAYAFYPAHLLILLLIQKIF